MRNKIIIITMKFPQTNEYLWYFHTTTIPMVLNTEGTASAANRRYRSMSEYPVVSLRKEKSNGPEALLALHSRIRPNMTHCPAMLRKK